MGCRAVATEKVQRKGRASLEFYKDGKPQYYCYGYIDMMYDETLPECKECKKYIDRALEDFERMKNNERTEIC